MSIRISQKNRSRGKVTFEFKPLKTFGKTLSSPFRFIIMNFPVSSLCSQDPLDPGPSHPLPERTRFQEWTCTSLYPPQLPSAWSGRCPIPPHTSTSSLSWDVPNYTAKVFTKGRLILHRICREWESGSDLEQLWLNNCVNVFEIHVFFQVKSAFHSQGRLDTFRRPRKSWVVP